MIDSFQSQAIKEFLKYRPELSIIPDDQITRLTEFQVFQFRYSVIMFFNTKVMKNYIRFFKAHYKEVLLFILFWEIIIFKPF